MSENVSRDTGVPEDPQAITEDIKQTREQLGQALRRHATRVVGVARQERMSEVRRQDA